MYASRTYFILQMTTNVLQRAVDVITCVQTQMDPSAVVVIRDIFSIAMVNPAEVGFRVDLLLKKFVNRIFHLFPLILSVGCSEKAAYLWCVKFRGIS